MDLLDVDNMPNFFQLSLFCHLLKSKEALELWCWLRSDATRIYVFTLWNSWMKWTWEWHMRNFQSMEGCGRFSAAVLYPCSRFVLNFLILLEDPPPSAVDSCHSTLCINISTWFGMQLGKWKNDLFWWEIILKEKSLNLHPRWWGFAWKLQK